MANTKGFPTSNVAPFGSLELLFAKEGKHLGLNRNSLSLGTAPYTHQPYSGVNTPGQFVPDVGRCFWIDAFSVDVYTDAPKGLVACELLIDAPRDAFNYNAPPPALGGVYMVKSGDSKTITFKNFVHENSGLLLLTWPYVDAADNTKQVYVRFNAMGGYELTNDLNFNARYTYLAFGDSIFDGIGATAGKNMIPFLIRDNLIDKGLDFRLVNKGTAGMTSRDFTVYKEHGHFDVEKADLITWCFGINDVHQGFDAAQQNRYRAAIRDAMRYRIARFPKTPMVFFGPTPVINETRHANLEIARNAVREEVVNAGGAAKGFYYKNLGDAFNRYDTAFYRPEDDAADRVHGSDAGYAAIAQAANTFIDSLNLKF